MTAERKSREVKAPHVNLLHKRRLGVNNALAMQHSADFLYYAVRFQHMLQHGLYPDPVDRTVGKWQLMPIGYQIGNLTAVYVRANEINAGIFIKRLSTKTDCRAANNQHHRTVCQLVHIG